jgi:hypothetical protein
MSKRLGLIGWIGVVFLVSAGAWLFAHPWILSREVSFSMQSSDAPRRWAMVWQGRRGEPENGAWIDARGLMAPEALEIMTPGTRPDGSKFWLHLDWVRGVGADGRRIDLRPALTSETTSGRWQEFGKDGGIAFQGPQPGSIRLMVPGGGVELQFARTREGGGFLARYAGTTERLDCFAEQEGRIKATIVPSRTELAIDGTITMRLPSYDISRLRLAWFGSTGKQAMVGEPRVLTKLLGFTIRDEKLELQAGASPVKSGEDVRYQVTLQGGNANELSVIAGAKEPAGAVGLTPPKALGVVWHLLGVGAIFGLALVASALGFVLVTILSIGRPQWLGVGFVILLAVVGVRLWMGSWAPILFLPDSVDYAAGGVNWVGGESLDRFRPVRVPGYAIFIGWLYQLPWKLNGMLSLTQGLMGVLTALLAWSISRKLMGRGWAALAFVVVGLNPLLIAWERCAMSETLTTFLITLIVWVVLWRRRFEARRTETTPTSAPRAAEVPVRPANELAWMGVSILAGVLLVVGVYVRGNVQVLVPLVPILIVMEASRRIGWRRGAVLGFVCLATSVGLLMPRILANKRDYGVASVMVASSRNQFILAEPNGVMDMNHARAFTFEQWRDMADLRAARKITEWDLHNRVNTSRAPVPVGRRGSPTDETRGPGVDEAKGEFVVKESYARRGPERLRVANAAMWNLIGLYPWSRLHGFQENEYWTRPLRGIDLTKGSNFFDTQAHAMKYGKGGEAIYTECHRDISGMVRGTNPRVFNEWFMGDRALRPLFAGLMLIGLLASLIRREWTMAWIIGAVVLHAGALAALTMAGIDRYGVPFEPLLRVGAVYGLSVLVGWWGHGMRRTWLEGTGLTG